MKRDRHGSEWAHGTRYTYNIEICNIIWRKVMRHLLETRFDCLGKFDRERLCERAWVQRGETLRDTEMSASRCTTVACW